MSRIEESRMPSEQPARPIMWPGDFVTARSPNAVSINPNNPAVHPGILCSRCRPMSDWLTTKQREHEQPGNLPGDTLRSLDSQGTIWREFEHYETGLQLEESYKEGCHLCTLIWQATVDKGKASWPGAGRGDKSSLTERSRWKKTRLTQIRRSTNVKIEIWGHNIVENLHDAADSLDTKIELTAQVTVSKFHQLTRKSVAIEIRPWPTHSTLVKQTDSHMLMESLVELTPSADFVSTSSRSVIQQAARWLDQCVNNHATCRHATTLTIPKRLLYLETVDKRIQVKLVELDENFSDLKYATLSYCWGKGSACKLTRASLETMRSGILLSDLPKTVQDALHVTQQLGLHWLWVDSLCIIQDSVDDWSSEAASMVDVYRNCLICIAATGAYCSDEGLFAQRDPYIYQPCPISNSSDATTLFAYPHRGLGNQGDFSLCFFESPLHKRGWVMQERLLPPRTLSFGSIVVWECCEHYRDEFCLSRGIEGGTLKGGFSSLVLQQVGPRQITPEEEAKILSLWQTIMQAYTQANLTVKTDKLVALSGVIRAIERSTGWRNIYGVWEPFLVYELLWRKQVSDSLGTTALPGASWSWVSWNGEIHQPIAYSRRVLDNALASFQGFDLQVCPGQVRQALIRISCVLFELESPSFDYMTGPRYSIRTGSRDYGIEITKDLKHGQKDPEIFLPLLYDVPSPHSWIDTLHVQGLALIPSSSSPGAYERVGYATLCSEKLFVQPILDGSSSLKKQIITLV